MTRITSLFVALALLAPLAQADDTFDLRALMNRKAAVGDRYRVSEEERGTMEQKLTRNGQAMPAQKRDTSPAITYVEEVEAVSADGEVTRKRRTLESFKDERGKDVDVTGIVVTLTKSEGAQGRWSFAAAEGSKAMPPAVEAAMRKDVDGENQRAEKGITEAQIHEVMFPAEAQAVGATWNVDMERAAPLLGMEPGDLDIPACTAKGTIEAVEDRAGESWVKAKITMTIVIKRMQGQQLPQPTPMDFNLTFALPSDGGVERDFGMVQHLDMTMAPQPGISMQILVHNERMEHRAAP